MKIKRERKGLRLGTARRNVFRFGLSSVTILFILAFLFVPYFFLDKADAVTTSQVNVQVNGSDFYLNFSPGYNNGNVEMNGVNPAVSSGNNKGSLNVAKKILNVDTNGQYYYVFLSMSGNDGYLRRNGTGDSANTKISPANGTYAAPAKLETNEWGFALVTSNFLTDTTKEDRYYPKYQLDDGTFTPYSWNGASTTAHYTAKYAQVPVYNPTESQYPVMIKSDSNNAGFKVDDGRDVNIPVYYGVMVDTNLWSGEYTGEIAYTAIASGNDINNTSSNIEVLKNFGGPGDTLTIQTNLRGYGLASDDIQVSLKQSDNTSNSVDCLNSVPEIGENGTTTITCTLGEGAADVQYDVYVEIPTYGISYSTYNNDTIGAFVYAGLQTINPETNEHYITKMQQMTKGICKLTSTWTYDASEWNGGLWAGTGTAPTTSSNTAAFYAVERKDNSSPALDEGSLPGTGAYIKTIAGDYTSTAKTTDPAVMTANSSWYAYMVNNYQFTLKDTRDGKNYLIRKLADGNCWMVQNLDLELHADTVLTAEDTDINPAQNGGYTTWTPTNNWSDNWVATTKVCVVDGQEVTGSACDSVAETDQRGVKCTLEQAGHKTTVTTANDVTTYACNYTLASSNLHENVVTQSGSQNGSAWTWANNASDGAHIYDQGNVFYRSTFTWTSATQNAKYTNSGTSSDTVMTAPVAYNVSGNSGNYIDYGSASTTKNTCGSGSGGTRYSTTTTFGTITQADGSLRSFSACADSLNGESTASSELAGNYYNFYAATAGTGNTSVTSGDVPDSICPYGWRLPSYSGTGSFNTLISTYISRSGNNSFQHADTALLLAPLSLVRGGYYFYYNGNLNHQSSYGYYWSRRLATATPGNYLDFYSGYVYPQYSYYRGIGFALRCLAR